MSESAQGEPRDLLAAWDRSPEELKRDISQELMRVKPKLFASWFKKSGLKGYRPAQAATRSAAVARSKLDRALHLPGFPGIDQILGAYFVDCRSRVNEAFLAEAASLGISSDRSTPELAGKALAAALKEAPQTPGFVELYEVALRCLDPGWFNSQDPGQGGPASPGVPRTPGAEPTLNTTGGSTEPGPHNDSPAVGLRPAPAHAQAEAISVGPSLEVAQLGKGAVRTKGPGSDDPTLRDRTDRNAPPAGACPCNLESLKDLQDVLQRMQRDAEGLRLWPDRVLSSWGGVHLAPPVELQGLAESCLAASAAVLAFGQTSGCKGCLVEKSVRTSCDLLHRAAGSDRSTIESFLELSEQVTSTLDALRTLHIRAQELTEQTNAVSTQLGDGEPPYTVPGSTRSGRELAELVRVMNTRHSDLVTRLESETAQRRELLIATIARLQADFKLPGDLDQHLRSLAERARQADLRGLADLEVERGELEQHFLRERSVLKVETVSNALVRDGFSSDMLDAVGPVLLRDDKPLLTLLFLKLLFETKQTPQGVADHPTSFIRAMLQALAALPTHANKAGLWISFLSSSSWVAVQPSHLDAEENVGTALRVALLLAAAHDSACRQFCYQTQAFDFISRTGLPALSGFADSIKANKRPRVVRDGLFAKAEEARKDAQARLDCLFTPVFSRNPHHRAGLTRILLPDLRKNWGRWQKVDATLATSELLQQQEEWRVEIEAICRADGTSFFRNSLLEELTRLCDAIRTFLDARAVLLGDPPAIQGSVLARELSKLAGDAPELDRVWAFLIREAAEPPQYPSCTRVEELLLPSCEILTTLPELAQRYREGPRDFELTAADFPLFAERLAEPLSLASAVDQLERGHCFDEAMTLVRDNPHGVADPDGLAKAADRFKAKLRLQIEEPTLSLDDLTKLELLDGLRRGHYPFVERRVRAVQLGRESRSEELIVNANQELRQLLTELRRVQDSVHEAGIHDDTWRRRTRSHLDTLLTSCLEASSTEQTLSEKQQTISALKRALPLARLHVEHGGHDFDALERAGNSDGTQRETPRVGRTAPDLSRLVDGDRSLTLRDQREAVWKAFGALETVLESPRSKDTIHELVLGIAKLVQMYGDEADKEHVRFSAIPGLLYGALETTFYKPGSPYFDHRYRIVAIPKGLEPDLYSEDLKPWIEEAHRKNIQTILIADSEAPTVKRRLSREIESGKVALVDRLVILGMLESEKPAPPLRQLLRRTASVEVTSPFKSEGWVSGTHDLFVGRDVYLKKLSNGRSWVLWGGRRSGKTSLLHAVGRRMKESRRSPYQAVYESLEALRAERQPDIDMEVARQIAAGLGWKRVPPTLHEFRRKLQEACEEQPICLLIDEVDAYLQSHLAAGAFDFPLIRELRTVANKAQDRFVCVFAGFKQLFRVVQLIKRPDDPAYPWHSWLQVTEPLARLALDESTDLVRQGFQDVLGIDLEPDVPSLIFEYTAGHPAFVQYFCECLLRRMQRRGRQSSPRITTDEVLATFKDDLGGPGAAPFISFVESTLDMNLSALERIVVYVTAAELIGPQGDPRAWLEREAVEDAVAYYLKAGGKSGATAALNDCFSYLSMTGMLEVDHRQSWRMAFSTYVEILRRLEEAKKGKIASLVAELKDPWI